MVSGTTWEDEPRLKVETAAFKSLVNLKVTLLDPSGSAATCHMGTMVQED